MSHMVEPTEGWTSHVSVTELKVTEGPCGLWFPESTPPVTFQAQSRAGPRFLPLHLHASTHTRSQTDPGPGLTSLPRLGQSEGVLSRGPHARMGNGHWPLSRLQVPLGEPEAPPSSGEAAHASNLPSILISGPNACWAAATLFW